MITSFNFRRDALDGDDDECGASGAVAAAVARWHTMCTTREHQCDVCMCIYHYVCTVYVRVYAQYTGTSSRIELMRLV